MSEQIGGISANEFYQWLAEAGAPNEMIFQLGVDSPQPDRTFSKEAISDVSSKFHDFVVARTFGRWKETKKPPHKMRVFVQISWEHEDLQNEEHPFFEGFELEGGMEYIDGSVRIPLNVEELWPQK